MGVTYLDTFSILEIGVRRKKIANWGELRDIYCKLRSMDSGYASIDSPFVKPQLKAFFSKPSTSSGR